MELFQIIGAMMEKECHQNMPFFTVRWLKYQRLGNYIQITVIAQKMTVSTTNDILQTQKTNIV